MEFVVEFSSSLLIMVGNLIGPPPCVRFVDVWPWLCVGWSEAPGLCLALQKLIIHKQYYYCTVKLTRRKFVYKLTDTIKNQFLYNWFKTLLNDDISLIGILDSRLTFEDLKIIFPLTNSKRFERTIRIL